MSTTTVRLDEDDEQILDKLAPAYGGRSNATRTPGPRHHPPLGAGDDLVLRVAATNPDLVDIAAELRHIIKPRRG